MFGKKIHMFLYILLCIMYCMFSPCLFCGMILLLFHFQDISIVPQSFHPISYANQFSEMTRFPISLQVIPVKFFDISEGTRGW